MITLSTHVLDSATGRPAAGMSVRLEQVVLLGTAPQVPDSPAWIALGTGVTDVDGRLNHWGDTPLGAGHHRLVFSTAVWFAELNRECFYPEVIITFNVKDDDSTHPCHYHVPLLLAAFAYSTYRGS